MSHDRRVQSILHSDKKNSCGETVESNICGEILTEKKIKIYSQAKV